MFAFKLDQVVWYMKDNKVHSSAIISRKYVDNKKSFTPLGNGGIIYATLDGVYLESELADSKENLLKTL